MATAELVDDRPNLIVRAVKTLRVIAWKIIGVGVTICVLGLSLLPLSALLVAFPALSPQESVLSDVPSRSESRGRRMGRRLFSIFAGLTVLLALLAVAVEITSRLPLPERGHFRAVSRALLPTPEFLLGQTPAEREQRLADMPPSAQLFFTTPLHDKLPTVMVEHWPVVILLMYLLDVGVLLMIGRVPIAYNLRNVRVRWKTNLMTGIAFLFVIGLLVFLLAFVTGMNNLTNNTGVPGNVFVLSDGSTDELFSNLGYGDLDNVERVMVDLDEKDRPLAEPFGVMQRTIDGKEKYLASRETYYVLNQPIPNTNPARRRFVQLRTLDDPLVAEAVHNVELLPGGRWFGESGVDAESRIECVLGSAVAATLGVDAGKPSLVPGDRFELGDMEWVVTGVTRSEGTTFGSEMWARRFSRIYGPFGKDKYTTLVLRTAPDTIVASRAMAYHLNTRYTQQKLKTFAEPDYYSEQTKTNNTFLVATVLVALVMAIGGVFGMMTTMFASIAQRIRDIGVLRLLGFKRWQVMVSFMLESLTIAFMGGLAGCLLAFVVTYGRSSTSTLSGGGGGPGGKTVAISFDVDFQVVALGLLFTLAMGRLGGLVPALGAMRLRILDSLK